MHLSSLQVANELSALSAKTRKAKARVLDMCCGVGFSTRALREAFPDSTEVVGLDTSAGKSLCISVIIFIW